MKYFFIAILFVAFGYAWAAKAYLPHIERLEAHVESLENSLLACKEENKNF